jgi:PBP1b-binding outer membrane lipoprotein LpoB
MKKLTIIAALAFTSLFFTSCESSSIAPTESIAKPATSDFQEPEFAKVGRNTNTEKPAVLESVTEVPLAIKPANVIAE